MLFFAVRVKKFALGGVIVFPLDGRDSFKSARLSVEVRSVAARPEEVGKKHPQNQTKVLRLRCSRNRRTNSLKIVFGIFTSDRMRTFALGSKGVFKAIVLLGVANGAPEMVLSKSFEVRTVPENYAVIENQALPTTLGFFY
jgi:hypothetical protein